MAAHDKHPNWHMRVLAMPSFDCYLHDRPHASHSQIAKSNFWSNGSNRLYLAGAIKFQVGSLSGTVQKISSPEPWQYWKKNAMFDISIQMMKQDALHSNEVLCRCTSKHTTDQSFLCQRMTRHRHGEHCRQPNSTSAVTQTITAVSSIAQCLGCADIHVVAKAKRAHLAV